MTVLSVRFTHPAATGSVRIAARQGVATIAAMLRARATRQLLATMDDRMLADIGVDRGTAMAEAARPMWDLAPRRL